MKWMFKIKEWKGMTMNEIYIILFGSNMEGMKWNHFMTKLLLDLYFKINS